MTAPSPFLSPMIEGEPRASKFSGSNPIESTGGAMKDLAPAPVLEPAGEVVVVDQAGQFEDEVVSYRNPSQVRRHGFSGPR